MANSIAPAFSDAEWRTVIVDSSKFARRIGSSPAECAENIALNNYALESDDNRKFIWADVDALTKLIDQLNGGGIGDVAQALSLLHIRNAIASYLVPRVFESAAAEGATDDEAAAGEAFLQAR